MSMRKKMVVGNWKMNLLVSESVDLSRKLTEQIGETSCEVVISPSTISILPVFLETKGTKILLAAQNVAEEEKGAYTGETSVLSMKPYVKYVIVGHSERRNLLGESDNTVAKKAEIAVRHGISPIICIGETAHQKEDGLSKVVVLSQLEASCKHLTADEIANTVIAYEPIWAVGAERVCSSEDADGMAREIRGLIKALYNEKASKSMRVLYGGDVNPENAGSFVKLENIDGVLVGRASLDSINFNKILKAFK